MTGWEADARASYDRVAAPYAELTRGAAAVPEMPAAYAQLAALARALAGQPLVVDVGCGPGWLAGHLAACGADALGIDVSPEMAALAARNAPVARFATGSILRLPLGDGAAYGVACWYVLHHVPDEDLDAALDELVRVLAPGGALLLGGHVGDSRGRKTQGYGGLPMDVQLNNRPAATWPDLLRARGLAVVKHAVEDPDGEHPTHMTLARRPATA